MFVDVTAKLEWHSIGVRELYVRQNRLEPASCGSRNPGSPKAICQPLESGAAAVHHLTGSSIDLIKRLAREFVQRNKPCQTTGDAWMALERQRLGAGQLQATINSREENGGGKGEERSYYDWLHRLRIR